jgi:hypothetical protein
MNEVEVFEVEDKIVKIYYDENVQSPRDSKWASNIDNFICFHKKYSLGDKHDYKWEGWNELEAVLIKDFDPVEIRPLYLYDHSGITISDHSFHDNGDNGQVGFLIFSKKAARENWSVKRITKSIREKVSKYLDASLEEYNQFLSGQVYGYEIYGKDNDGEEGEFIDSCWGFYGLDYVKKEATEAAKNAKVKEVENPNQLQLALNI